MFKHRHLRLDGEKKITTGRRAAGLDTFLRSIFNLISHHMISILLSFFEGSAQLAMTRALDY